ncbi:selenocysteine-specific translation elongation factor [Cytobacillus spongiae]|jgi:selenocysteine-specific elongation factor|uniref:selenocysteine-specific translation elongation factor n=1 Tax=Cytobacillus spongiae TaxID=2901381 RepID=UPI001F4764E0|nr:selenocysteine-specific translation elongation factor [Cytobacillus spongiae]UII57719.1 selenocysteine-specific translation elongation factor [Cytobacillus spongiae]
MSKRYFTIGMAGHIDHGKTTLTKALTNIDTDRLKEEKERQISIELGFAPLHEDDELQISVVDVPGHERFIRQMIAGVAGIDLVVLVVAADEGVMPQTREHLEILRFLGIQTGIVAITKIDRVDHEFIDLVKDDILEELQGTVFEEAPFVLVDSLTKKGIDVVKDQIIHMLKAQNVRDSKGAFRLPIDQVFTVKGQGTVVRGTVYEGTVEEGQLLQIMPRGEEVRARQLQVHHQPAERAYAGQRTAINLSGVSKDDVVRGDVLVSSEHFIVTNTIDVSVRFTSDLDYLVKQRMPIKCHIGTAEVMGRIVFFDRNELKEESDEILCQLRLDEEIVTKRGDRFILRRPSPQETIGGGWVIDPNGEKYRFGNQTIEKLSKKKVGTPKERITAALWESKSLPIHELVKQTALDEDVLSHELSGDEFICFNGKDYTTAKLVHLLEEDIFDRLHQYHLQHTMKQGLNKAVLLQSMQDSAPKQLIEYVLDQGIKQEQFNRKGQFLHLADYQPSVPKNWQKRAENLLEQLKQDGFKVVYFQDYLKTSGIPADLHQELKHFFEEDETIVPIDEQYAWHGDHFRTAVSQLKAKTGTEFEVADAKDVLGLSRKYMIPFLETLDSKGFTKRIDNKRVWI